MNHTPGPWKVFDAGIRYGIDSENGLSIIAYSADEKDDSGVWGDTTEEMKANAQLIAAAP